MEYEESVVYLVQFFSHNKWHELFTFAPETEEEMRRRHAEAKEKHPELTLRMVKKVTTTHIVE